MSGNDCRLEPSSAIASSVLSAVESVNSRVESLLLSLELESLPSVLLTDKEGCTASIPSGVSGLYFLWGQEHGLLYVGKARNLRARWHIYPWHQYHDRCLELGGVRLSWFALDELALEVAETVAIRVLAPHWNIRKNPFGCRYGVGVPSRHLDVELGFQDVPEIPESTRALLQWRSW